MAGCEGKPFSPRGTAFSPPKGAVGATRASRSPRTPWHTMAWPASCHHPRSSVTSLVSWQCTCSWVEAHVSDSHCDLWVARPWVPIARTSNAASCLRPRSLFNSASLTACLPPPPFKQARTLCRQATKRREVSTTERAVPTAPVRVAPWCQVLYCPACGALHASNYFASLHPPPHRRAERSSRLPP